MFGRFVVMFLIGYPYRRKVAYDTMANKPELIIKNLACQVEDSEILHDVNLTVRGGEIHVVMGPNGAGKSTLASALMGHPRYEVTAGEVTLDEHNILELEVDERARAGLFLAMQYPAEIDGVTNSDFMRTAMNAQRPADQQVGLFPFRRELAATVDKLEMLPELPERYINEGFSGGEKKRNEILQMMMLKPRIAILDEIDSGLDIDALRIVGKNIMELSEEQGEKMGFLVITHYQRLLDYVKPDYVHILMNGRIVKTGGPELAQRLEADGYEWLREELGLEVAEEDRPDSDLRDLADLNKLFG